MEIITRKEAVKLGLKRYFTGKPCKHGHVSEKYSSNRGCVVCKKDWSKNNPDKVKSTHESWRAANSEKIAANSRKWLKANPERAAYNSKSWKKDNPEKVAAMDAKRRATKLNAIVPWSDKELIESKYWYARFLTETVGVAYHVDHIVPLQGKNVCGLHVENNLQVITAKENLSKSNKF